MIRGRQRFRNHLDEQLIHLRKNLHINPADPLYYEKVIRYVDAQSPEAHYKLGQKFQQRGNSKQALFHYGEVLKKYPSPFYSAAHRAIRNIEEQSAAALSNAQTAHPKRIKPLLPPLIKMLLVLLFILNLLIGALFLGEHPIYNTISSMKLWGVGTDITYETMDAPFVMYFHQDDKSAVVESALHNQAIALSKNMPKHNIIIYGLVSNDARDQGKTLTLTNTELTKSAVVIAQYHPDSDRTVKIRFLNSQFEQRRTLNAVGANLVRTALEAYQNEKGQFPATLELLLQNYPNNYLSFIPLEATTGSNKVGAAFDGSGGWVYNPGGDHPEVLFYANVQGAEASAYEPLHIEINKAQHRLKVVSGSHLLWEKPIGLGANDSTPVGDFVVQDRVLKPKGKQPQSYGDAALGLGAIALHGTIDESSIGGDKSLGCVRLSNADVQQLFAFVPKGSEVQIAASDWPSKDLADVGGIEGLIPLELPKMDQAPQHIIFHWLG